jgi:hypothetical protein
MKAGSGLAQAQSKPFCTTYALVGTGAFINAALLTVPKPTRTPSASKSRAESRVRAPKDPPVRESLSLPYSKLS